jgi:casein kinase 1 alpha
MLERLEAIHNLGFTHNDIKPDNIMLGSKNFKDKSSSNIYLIDFGISSKYLDNHGVHLGENEPNLKVGCVLFASPNLWKKNKLSRRDDLISLVYTLVFFLQGELTFLELGNGEKEKIKMIGDKKIKTRPSQICVGNAECLLGFTTEVFKLEFMDKPNYGKLRHLLTKELLK